MTLILTPTRDRLSSTRVAVKLSPGGGRSIVSLESDCAADRPVVRPMLLSSDDRGARVSLVPEGALLLADDEIAIDVRVGPGACLELVEPGGTVAYAMGGACASWEVMIELAPSACLVWAGEPFIVSEGATVLRSTAVTLGEGAVLAMREMLVLGRHGERPGEVRQVLDARNASGVPLLRDSLHVGRADDRLLLGGARAVGTVLTLGERLPDTSEGARLDLEADGTMVRMLGDDVHRALPVAAWSRARVLRS